VAGRAAAAAGGGWHCCDRGRPVLVVMVMVVVVRMHGRHGGEREGGGGGEESPRAAQRGEWGAEGAVLPICISAAAASTAAGAAGAAGAAAAGAAAGAAAAGARDAPAPLRRHEEAVTRRDVLLPLVAAHDSVGPPLLRALPGQGELALVDLWGEGVRVVQRPAQRPLLTQPWGFVRSIEGQRGWMSSVRMRVN
jgi:hypothetical protein